MLSLFIGWLATTRLGKKWAKPAAIALLIVAAVGIFFGAKAIYDHSVIDKHEKKLERRAAPATTKATEQRAADAETRAKQSEEMNNVIASVPDQPINPVSHARACKQLQRAGRRVAACDRPNPPS